MAAVQEEEEHQTKAVQASKVQRGLTQQQRENSTVEAVESKEHPLEAIWITYRRRSNFSIANIIAKNTRSFELLEMQKWDV